jgi:hypothetical protein
MFSVLNWLNQMTVFCVTYMNTVQLEFFCSHDNNTDNTRIFELGMANRNFVLNVGELVIMSFIK